MDSEPNQTFKIVFVEAAKGSKRRINDTASSKFYLPVVLDKGIQLLTSTKNFTPVVTGVLGPPPHGWLKILEKFSKHLLILLRTCEVSIRSVSCRLNTNLCLKR